MLHPVEHRVAPDGERAAEQDRIDPGVAAEVGAVGRRVERVHEDRTPDQDHRAKSPQQQRLVALGHPAVPHAYVEQREQQVEVFLDR